MNKYIFPQLGLKFFNCPHCHVFAEHKYNKVHYGKTPYGGVGVTMTTIGGESSVEKLGDLGNNSNAIHATNCEKCHEFIVWLGIRKIYPESSSVPYPNEKMPEKVKDFYIEASNIFDKSPRAASAIIRLGIETLLKELEVKGKDLNDMIGNFSSKEEVPSKVQMALDAIRYYGNQGVHSAQIDLEDNQDSVLYLFALLNMIVEEVIVNDQKRQELYDNLPSKFKASIEKRTAAKKLHNL